MQKATFTIDCLTQTYDGYTAGDTWNGFARPSFDHHTATRILQNSANNGYRAYYHPATDTFVVGFADATDSVDWDQAEHYTGQTIEIDGQPITVYPIGSGSWTWTEVKPILSDTTDWCALPLSEDIFNWYQLANRDSGYLGYSQDGPYQGQPYTAYRIRDGIPDYPSYQYRPSGVRYWKPTTRK
jgi:hypothetical protein